MASSQSPHHLLSCFLFTCNPALPFPFLSCSGLRTLTWCLVARLSRQAAQAKYRIPSQFSAYLVAMLLCSFTPKCLNSCCLLLCQRGQSPPIPLPLPLSLFFSLFYLEGYSKSLLLLVFGHTCSLFLLMLLQVLYATKHLSWCLHLCETLVFLPPTSHRHMKKAARMKMHNYVECLWGFSPDLNGFVMRYLFVLIS